MGASSVWIAGSYQSDFARNYAREGLEISDMVAEAVTGTLRSGTHSCWAPGESIKGWD